MVSNQQEAHESEAGGIDLRFYWTVVKKRLWLIVAATLVVTSLAVVMSIRKPKIYEATATAIVDPQAPNVLGNQVEVVQLGSGNAWINQEYYNTQIEILTSRKLANRVVNLYGLHRDARLVPQTTGAEESLLIDEATRALQDRIKVEIKKESRVFAISVSDRDPQLAMQLANQVRDVFIKQNLDVKRDVTKDAGDSLVEQLDKASHRLRDSETALIGYKETNNILSVSLEDRQNQLSRDLETYSTSLSDARKKRIDLQARRKVVALALDDDTYSVPTTYLNASPTLDALRTTLLEERQKLTALDERYGPKHPEYVVQAVRVSAALASLKEEAKTTLRAIDAEIRAIRDAEGAYEAELERLTQEAFQVNKKEIDYRPLARAAAQAEQDYKKLLDRLSETGQQKADIANNIRDLDAALLPSSPVKPNLKLDGMIGFAVGLMLSFGLAFLVEFMDRSVKSQEDVESAIGVPFLGLVPSVEERQSHPELTIAREPNSTFAECCRVIRTNILFSSPDRPLRTVLVTSANPTEGKTMTVVNLGVVMAQSGHRTLLVDTDMRRPRLHKALGIANDGGLSRVVVGESELEDAVKSTEVPNLFLLPCGPIPPNPAELLQTEKFAALAKSLLDRYDRVIFDSPPVLAVTDAAVLSRVVDGTIFVVRANRTSRDSVTRGKRAISRVNPKIVGVVLNDVNLRSPHYSTYYQYYYQYKYKYQSTPATAGARDDA